MPAFLTFALAAPLGAMGALAVGERRDSWPRPARSAVLGVIAACLGLRRDDEAAHTELEVGLRLALLMETTGRVLADYHTVQVPPRPARGRRFHTRAEELAEHKLNTILTRREYREDVLSLVAIWLAGTATAPSLSRIAAAMERPSFTPYLGRKSCPLGLPLAPWLFEAPDPLIALARRRDEGIEAMLRTQPLWDTIRPLARAPTVAIDASEADGRFGLTGVRREYRRDAIASRHRWQFALREEVIIALPDAGGAACS